MPNLLDNASAWLDRQFRTHASSTVTYRRGGAGVEIVATIGRSVHQDNRGDGGPALRVVSRDYLVDVAELVLGDTLIEPKAGDRIRETQADGRVAVYEVATMPGEPAWRFSDSFRRRFRIHTKFVGMEGPD